MFDKPQHEHHWFDKLLGKWNCESTCWMGPDQAPMTNRGTAEVRSLGGLWVLVEGQGEPMEGETWSSIMTLGYDPKSKRYTGTFIGSMMTHLWVYDGALDASGRTLVLDTEGPKHESPGMARYQDIIEIVDDNHWILKSQILTDDGRWKPIMEG